jgi:radical SAM superfamily enzyme YgiQ (UPF0313 family)
MIAPRLICLIQPPLIQLNSPYPSLYYLKTFLEKRGHKTLVRDHSIALFERIFCRLGLERIFAGVAAADAAPAGTLWDRKNKHIAYNIERFLSERDRWLSCIDRLTDFLRGRDREFGHFLALANGVLPGGPRFDGYLASLSGNPLPGDAPLLASTLLADLADLITVTLDPSFSLIRYAGYTGGAGFRDFSLPEKNMDGYIFREFYRPLLEEQWDALDRVSEDPEQDDNKTAIQGPLVLGATIPFPGCLAGALLCAASAKAHYGHRVTTIAGGGYVNTELRFLDAPEFFNYFDYLSFDRGYGALAAILEKPDGEAPLYKTMYRAGDRIIRGPGIDYAAQGAAAGGIAPGKAAGGVTAETARFQAIDRESARTVFPDYTEVDFSRYLYPVDDLNPMHRLWSDGHWLKAYLAHGCYWGACAFCDVRLDYIRGFEPVDTAALFAHLLDQSRKTGVRAVHLVDEAAPAASLLQLALLNREAGLPLIFWGNIRFDRDFTTDTAAILAAGGLVGVSGGIEVVTDGGLKRIGKGISIKDAAAACAGFKEAGILTHAYLIYGYWDEDDREIIDSAEILRQFFAAGLLDSAFWHKFVLTRHSRIYAEWERGLHRLLRVRDGKNGSYDTSDKAGGIFALNDLSFNGEERFDRFTKPLDLLLYRWMAGDTGVPPEDVFPFTVPVPGVPPDLVEKLLDGYAHERDLYRATHGETHRAAAPEHAEARHTPADHTARALFLGSRPVIRGGGKARDLRWRWRLEDQRLGTGEEAAAGPSAKLTAVKALLEEAAWGEGPGAEDFYERLEGILGAKETPRAWKVLRNSGLAVYQHKSKNTNE